jgi:hypothetical protein
MNRIVALRISLVSSARTQDEPVFAAPTRRAGLFGRKLRTRTFLFVPFFFDARGANLIG